VSGYRKWKISLSRHVNKCQWNVPVIIEKCVLLVRLQKEEEMWQMVEISK